MDKKMDTFVFVVCLLAMSILISPARTIKGGCLWQMKGQKKRTQM